MRLITVPISKQIIHTFLMDYLHMCHFHRERNRRGNRGGRRPKWIFSHTYPGCPSTTLGTKFQVCEYLTMFLPVAYLCQAWISNNSACLLRLQSKVGEHRLGMPCVRIPFYGTHEYTACLHWTKALQPSSDVTLLCLHLCLLSGWGNYIQLVPTFVPAEIPSFPM